MAENDGVNAEIFFRFHITYYPDSDKNNHQIFGRDTNPKETYNLFFRNSAIPADKSSGLDGKM